jgi:tetratricopeptide (TPR) repeat protein
VATAAKAVALAPHNADAQWWLARILVGAGRPAEASAALETALRLDPRPSPQGSFRAGWTLYHLHQYERAIAMLQRARQAMPHNFMVREGLAVSYAQLGRLDEAKAERQAMQEIWPGANFTVFRISSTFKREEDLAHFLDGLQKAGLPEWPYGFAGREEDRLNGDEIAAVTFGRTWVGSSWTGKPFSATISQDGAFVWRHPTSTVTGTFWVEGDRLCGQSPELIKGRTYCNLLYRNPPGRPEDQNEYVRVHIYSVYYFSVQP